MLNGDSIHRRRNIFPFHLPLTPHKDSTGASWSPPLTPNVERDLVKQEKP